VSAVLVLPGPWSFVAYLSLVIAGAPAALLLGLPWNAAPWLTLSELCGSGAVLLLVWLSAGLAFAGLARCVLVLEARRGRLDLTRYHGGYDRMPLLAITFLAMGLACTGFPGTLGFIGQELLVDGAVEAFPVMGFAIVIASALTGLAVLRMYWSLFCGRPDPAAHPSLRLGLKTREAWTFVALVVALVSLGVAPRALVDSRLTASRDILRARQQHMSRGVRLDRAIRRIGGGWSESGSR